MLVLYLFIKCFPISVSSRFVYKMFSNMFQEINHVKNVIVFYTDTDTSVIVPATFLHLAIVPVRSFPGWFHKTVFERRPDPSSRLYALEITPFSFSRAVFSFPTSAVLRRFLYYSIM